MDTALVKVIIVDGIPVGSLTSFSIQTLQKSEIALEFNAEFNFSCSSSEETGLPAISCFP